MILVQSPVMIGHQTYCLMYFNWLKTSVSATLKIADGDWSDNQCQQL